MDKKKKIVRLFTSESVSEGHPDKVADKISDAILDACIERDPDARVACETAVGPDVVFNLGEITCRGCDRIDFESIARAAVKSVGYDRPEEHFSHDTFKYVSAVHGQSADIARGVDRKSRETQGAGDQGMMFGYATRETPAFMPATAVYSHAILRHLAKLRKSRKIKWLRPDAKAQVTVGYDAEGRPAEITHVVISHQTEAAVPIRTVRKELEAVARALLAETGLLAPGTRFFVNPTGRFVTGGPAGDSGLTGRKIIVDTYGGVAAHGGGAFSGKDPSKVDRSASYYARYVAKNIVAAGLAERCQLQVAYAIGVDRPVSIAVDTFGTGAADDAKIAEFLMDGSLFDFRPGVFVEELGLRKPKGWRYCDTVNYGHFGREGFPWESTGKAARLRKMLGPGRAGR